MSRIALYQRDGNGKSASGRSPDDGLLSRCEHAVSTDNRLQIIRRVHWGTEQEQQTFVREGGVGVLKRWLKDTLQRKHADQDTSTLATNIIRLIQRLSIPDATWTATRLSKTLQKVAKRGPKEARLELGRFQKRCRDRLLLAGPGGLKKGAAVPCALPKRVTWATDEALANTRYINQRAFPRSAGTDMFEKQMDRELSAIKSWKVRRLGFAGAVLEDRRLEAQPLLGPTGQLQGSAAKRAAAAAKAAEKAIAPSKNKPRATKRARTAAPAGAAQLPQQPLRDLAQQTARAAPSARTPSSKQLGSAAAQRVPADEPTRAASKDKTSTQGAVAAPQPRAQAQQQQGHKAAGVPAQRSPRLQQAPTDCLVQTKGDAALLGAETGGAMRSGTPRTLRRRRQGAAHHEPAGVADNRRPLKTKRGRDEDSD